MKHIVLAGCLALGVLALSAGLNPAQAQHGHGHGRSAASCYGPGYRGPGYRSGYGVYQQSLVVRPGFSYSRASLYGPPLSPYGVYGLSPYPGRAHHHHHHSEPYSYGYGYRSVIRPVGPGISLRIGF